MECSLFLAVKIQIINDEIGKSKFCQGLSNFLKGNFLLSKRHCGRASRTMAHNTPMSMYMSPSIPRQNRYVPCGGARVAAEGTKLVMAWSSPRALGPRKDAGPR